MIIPKTLGFVGLGVMGGPMCRNLAEKCGLPVTAYDRDRAALEESGGRVGHASDLAEVAAADAVFLSLPGGPELETVGSELLKSKSSGYVVDHTTAPVKLTRFLAAAFREKGVAWLDAPVARTRAAAEAGTLAIMVGGGEADFETIRPLLECMGEEITHCGGVGAGQVVKLLNNMVLFQTVNALGEALAMGKAAGVDPSLLFETLSKGSADSFALRNHGMKAMLPGDFPKRAFSTRYALKDLDYALQLAEEAGIDARGARLVREIFEDSVAAGYGDRYFPVLARLIEKE